MELIASNIAMCIIEYGRGSVTPAEFGTVASKSAFHSMMTSRSSACATDVSAPTVQSTAMNFLSMLNPS
jgi:hypothetical protein